MAHLYKTIFALLFLGVGLGWCTRTTAQNVLDFDGNDDRIVVPNASAQIANSNLSMALWVYPTNPNPGWPDFDGIAGFRNDANADFYLLQLSTTNLEARFRGNTGTNYDIVYNGLVLNAWNHLVFTYNGTNLVLYHNGSQVGTRTASGTITNTTVPLNIGFVPFSNPDFLLDGQLDDVCLWNKALTANEVSTLYNACGADLTDTNLRLCYEFNQGTAGGNNAGMTTATDSKGNINGTLTGFTLNGTTSNYVTGGIVTASTLTPTTACSYTSPSGNDVWSTSGTYRDTLTNAAGCDSIITINLTILGGNLVTLNPSVCTDYTSPSGNYTWNTSGTYQDTVVTGTGCDTLYTINLTVNNNTGSLTDTACASYTSPSGNHIWTTTGTYQDTLTNAAGCDSVLTVDLTILNSAPVTLSPVSCEAYQSPSGNHIWTTTGMYMDTLTNAAGCDSLLVIDLTVVVVDVSVTQTGNTLMANATGATYQWLDCDNSNNPIPGETNASYTATADGSYAVLVTQNGCSDTSACTLLTPSGVEEDFVAALQVYPNPFLDQLTLDLGSQHAIIEVTLFDLAGKAVKEVTFNHQSLVPLKLEGPAGMYVMRIIADGKQATIKVIKQDQR